MANIVFRMYPTKSHHNATFEIARQLGENKHNITYVATFELKDFVKAQGFGFYELKEDLFPKLKKKASQRITMLDFFKRDGLREKALFIEKFMAGGFFDNMIRDLKPDLILFDSTYTYFILDLFKSKIPIATIETMFSLDRNIAVPPLTSKFIPRNKWYDRFIIGLLWFGYSLSHLIKETRYQIFGSKISMDKLMKDKAVAVGCPLSMIKKDRVFYPRMTKYPELLVSPKELDFNREKTENQYCIGTGINIDRHESHHDLSYYQKRDILFARRVIYCAFGNVSTFHNRYCKEFYIKLIKAVEELDYNLILSIGNDLGLKVPIPANVFIFRSVPQIEVLKKCKIMINHGGLNSITECLMVGVPMIVYPLSSSSDQNGNSARVKFHNIGIRGDLRKDTSDDILKKIREIDSNEIYKANISLLKSKIINNRGDARVVIEPWLN